MSVGMAIAEKWLASRYDQPGFEIFDYNIYAVCGDGCLMEGVASEAASLAGHLGLDNLCWVYDNNHITIEGNTKLAFTEDVAGRFLAYGWNVLRIGDANDCERIEEALDIFHKTKGRPTFIFLDSHIGYGSPNKQDTAAAHGEPLGDEEVRLTKRSYGWPEDEKFLVPDGVYEHFAAGVGARGRGAGLNFGMGAIRWPIGSSHRHEDIRGIGAAQGVAEEVRVRTGPGGCGRKEAIGESLVKMKGISMTKVIQADLIHRTGPMLLPLARPANHRRTGLSGQDVGAADVLFLTCVGHSLLAPSLERRLSYSQDGQG